MLCEKGGKWWVWEWIGKCKVGWVMGVGEVVG